MIGHDLVWLRERAAGLRWTKVQAAFRGSRVRRLLLPCAGPQERAKLVYALRATAAKAEGQRRQSAHLMHLVDALRGEVRRLSEPSVGEAANTTRNRTRAEFSLRPNGQESDGEPMMAVAEHERILAVQRRASAEELERAKDVVKAHRTTVRELRKELGGSVKKKMKKVARIPSKSAKAAALAAARPSSSAAVAVPPQTGGGGATARLRMHDLETALAQVERERDAARCALSRAESMADGVQSDAAAACADLEAKLSEERRLHRVAEAHLAAVKRSGARGVLVAGAASKAAALEAEATPAAAAATATSPTHYLTGTVTRMRQRAESAETALSTAEQELQRLALESGSHKSLFHHKRTARLEKDKARFSAQVDAMAAELAAHEGRMAALRDAHSVAIGTLERQHTDAVADGVADAVADAQSELNAMHAGRVAMAHATHTAEIIALDRRHVDAAAADVAAAIEEARATHESAVASAVSNAMEQAAREARVYRATAKTLLASARSEAAVVLRTSEVRAKNLERELDAMSAARDEASEAARVAREHLAERAGAAQVALDEAEAEIAAVCKERDTAERRAHAERDGAEKLVLALEKSRAAAKRASKKAAVAGDKAALALVAKRAELASAFATAATLAADLEAAEAGAVILAAASADAAAEAGVMRAQHAADVAAAGRARARAAAEACDAHTALAAAKVRVRGLRERHDVDGVAAAEITGLPASTSVAATPASPLIRINEVGSATSSSAGAGGRAPPAMDEASAAGFAPPAMDDVSSDDGNALPPPPMVDSDDDMPALPAPMVDSADEWSSDSADNSQVARVPVSQHAVRRPSLLAMRSAAGAVAVPVTASAPAAALEEELHQLEVVLTMQLAALDALRAENVLLKERSDVVVSTAAEAANYAERERAARRSSRIASDGRSTAALERIESARSKAARHAAELDGARAAAEEELRAAIATAASLQDERRREQAAARATIDGLRAQHEAGQRIAAELRTTRSASVHAIAVDVAADNVREARARRAALAAAERTVAVASDAAARAETRAAAAEVQLAQAATAAERSTREGAAREVERAVAVQALETTVEVLQQQLVAAQLREIKREELRRLEIDIARERSAAAAEAAAESSSSSSSSSSESEGSDEDEWRVVSEPNSPLVAARSSPRRRDKNGLAIVFGRRLTDAGRTHYWLDERTGRRVCSTAPLSRESAAEHAPRASVPKLSTPPQMKKGALEHRHRRRRRHEHASPALPSPPRSDLALALARFDARETRSAPASRSRASKLDLPASRGGTCGGARIAALHCEIERVCRGV